MPGYGFSGKPTSTGWGPERMARAWAQLMRRLGYTRYVAQGGDWGAFVVDQMALQAPAGLLAIHTNMPATVPADVDKALLAGAPPPAGLSAEETRAYEQLVRTFKQVDYARLMGSRPQTLYGIADSPVGLAAWLLDHNDATASRRRRSPRRWIARAAPSANSPATRSSTTYALLADEHRRLRVSTLLGIQGRLLQRQRRRDAGGGDRLPGEQYQAPRSWTERAYPSSSTTAGPPKAATSPRGSSQSFHVRTQSGVRVATLNEAVKIKGVGPDHPKKRRWIEYEGAEPADSSPT